MTHAKPTRIYTLGDYYNTPYLREDCHKVKEGNIVTLNEHAYQLARKLPKDCTLVPIPSHNGGTRKLAILIAYYAKLPVVYCLERDFGRSLYDIKKDGIEITEDDTTLALRGNAPSGRIVLVDNVIATGTTMSAAIRAIGKPCEAAVIAVDYEQYNNN